MIDLSKKTKREKVTLPQIITVSETYYRPERYRPLLVAQEGSAL